MSNYDAEPSRGRISAQMLGHGASSPLPSVSLSRSHITEALSKSPDNGATLDLARKGLTDVGESGAEEMAMVGQEDDTGADSTVVRIALAYNRLTTLPMAFSLLLRLRYLVLKSNNFTVFPEVLTVMPSLEILDISRNKIKRLPSEPGSLTNLRVFSLQKNKIHRLPTYLCEFRRLSTFKVEQNPITWPPKAVMESYRNLDDAQAMSDWIKSLQAWLGDNASPSDERKLSDDSTQNEQGSRHPGQDTVIEDNSDLLQQAPSRRIPLRTPSLFHIRSLSAESDSSAYFQMDRSRPGSDTDPSPPVTRPDFASRLHDDPFLSRIPRSTSTSPVCSPETYLPPADLPPIGEGSASNNLTVLQQAHSRHESYVIGGHKPLANGPLAKKSMPDLRPARLHLATNSGIPRSMPTVSSGGSLDNINGFQISSAITSEPTTASPVSIDRSAPPMDVERNSYFRRLSSLTPATLSKTIPQSLLTLVDAIRGVLFALSQIYQTLQHYTVYAIDERLSAVLLKVLGPASSYMTQLINALDRFDTMSRRTLPSPPVCRAVVESCRDNVTIFGKAVGMLSLQLKVLATHDDVRYTRQMLLVLYGAMSEIAGSWQAMAGHIEAVRPLLWEARRPPVAKSHSTKNAAIRAVTTPSADKSNPPPASAPPMTSSPFLPAQDPPRSHLRTNTAQRSLDLGKSHISRRHAGSFSSKDVEIGKMLPSYVGAPPFNFGVVNGLPLQIPPTRTMRRIAVSPAQHTPDGILPQSSSMKPWTTHSRQGSQNSLLASSSSSSSGLLGARQEPSSSTNTLVDKEVIGAMKLAVEAAPALWEMMDEIIDESSDTKDDMNEALSKARDITERLRESIEAVQYGAPTVDGRTLHDDAHIFVKTVIQLSNAIKTHGAARPLSSPLRTNMVKLTNATQEFVMLLHVSSYSPRPYSPMVSLMAQPTLGLPDDGRLGSNLARRRSVLPSASLKLASALRDPPRSALPHQTFTIPNPPHFGPLRREVNMDSALVPG